MHLLGAEWLNAHGPPELLLALPVHLQRRLQRRLHVLLSVVQLGLPPHRGVQLVLGALQLLACWGRKGNGSGSGERQLEHSEQRQRV